MTITEFLMARLDEDEATARAAVYVPGSDEFNWSDVDYNSVVASTHGMRWSPERVLADIAAKRAIVRLYEGSGLRITMGQVLRALAQPYAEHPDFDPAWRAG